MSPEPSTSADWRATLQVSAVIPAHNRPRALARVLEHLADEPISEIVIVDNASSADLTGIMDLSCARFVREAVNGGVKARNVAAEIASGDLLLMLDDDSYPQPGTVEAMRATFERLPRLGALGGKVVDMEPDDARPIRTGEEFGSFHWLSRYGLAPGDDAGPEGVPSFLAAEGASMVRRAAYLQVGGCFEPYFRELTELDLATRLLAAGWDVRYLSSASFGHMRSDEWRAKPARRLRFRVRNQIWYFWRHFPGPVAARRIICYLAFDLIECTYRRLPGAWAGGLVDAWRQRRMVRGTRRPVDRATIPRVELHRGRAHAALLLHGIASRVFRL